MYQGPVVIHTKLGWVLSCPVSECDETRCSTNLVTTHVLGIDASPAEDSEWSGRAITIILGSRVLRSSWYRENSL